ncbi:MAG: TetR/AcrR family transcriptional regulator [Spirochaetaceae bacterium]|nr:MAG: TetR/AcrR family transcriptional regulator [Spirochaetaceae bacterium]
MAPKTQFDEEAIVEAAFEIARDEGFEAITARSVAARLGSSVAPIYVNFAAIEDLTRAVVERVFRLSEEYLRRQQGPSVFENMGLASLAFARDYPVLVRELATKPNPYMQDYAAQEEAMISMMGSDPELGGWSVEERRRLFMQMRAFQLGLTLMVANNQVPSWFGEADLERLVLQTGSDLVRAGNINRKEKNT